MQQIYFNTMVEAKLFLIGLEEKGIKGIGIHRAGFQYCVVLPVRMSVSK